MGVPGCPDWACSTASMASTRIELMTRQASVAAPDPAGVFAVTLEVRGTPSADSRDVLGSAWERAAKLIERSHDRHPGLRLGETRSAVACHTAWIYLRLRSTESDTACGAVPVTDEPEYLKALRRRQQSPKSAPTSASKAGPGAGNMPPTPSEREAIRWAQEVGGRDVSIAPSVRGAKVAILVQPITPFGKPRTTLEGHPSREALVERIRQATGTGENVLGCFELTTGRPLTPETVEGKVTFKAGEPRQILKAESRERMIRLATRQAEMQAKTRKLEDRTPGGGNGGRGRPGR